MITINHLGGGFIVVDNPKPYAEKAARYAVMELPAHFPVPVTKSVRNTMCYADKGMFRSAADWWSDEFWHTPDPSNEFSRD